MAAKERKEHKKEWLFAISAFFRGQLNGYSIILTALDEYSARYSIFSNVLEQRSRESAANADESGGMISRIRTHQQKT